MPYITCIHRWTLRARLSGGSTLHVISVKYMGRLGVTSAEIQPAVWFAMTIIGVVIFSGRFFTWPRLEQIVATLVLVGPGWLLVRTGE